VDLAEWPEEFLPTLLERMDGFHADAFHVYFDHIAEGKIVALRSHKAQRGVNIFRKRLAGFLRARDFQDFAIPGKAHVTLRYDRDGKGYEPIDPVSWRVDEVLLIESLGGKSMHIERGRWQLNPLLI
jgi:2'-5' RNA ligase